MWRPWEKKTEEVKYYSSQIIKKIRKTCWQLKINYLYVYICIYTSLYIRTYTQMSHLAVYIQVIHRDKYNPYTLYRLCTCINSPCVCVCVCVCVHIYIYIYVEKEREREKLGYCTKQAHTNLHNGAEHDSEFYKYRSLKLQSYYITTTPASCMTTYTSVK